ncbi:MAG: helix-turn-helix domain-containing protein [Lacticaseibacillus songhuajiangensis]|nr:helix-turn-helix domain-containing protein [Lacticaseibacillus songhuajiangensis]
MLTYELFLSRSDRARLEFYQQFIDLPSKFQDVNQVAKIRKVSATSVYRTLTKITQDLSELRTERHLPAVDDTASFRERFNIPASIYAVFLMRRSIVGKFLLATLKHPDWTVNEFAEAHRISNATVFRRLRPLKECLKSYDIRLNYGPIGLSGSETAVRVALGELCWQLAQDGTSLFPELHELDVRTATVLHRAGIGMPNVAPTRLQVLCGVGIIRDRQGHQLHQLQPLSDILTATGFASKIRGLPDAVKAADAQAGLIHAETMLTASFHDSDDPILIGFIGHHARTNSPAWRLVQQVLQRMHSQAGVDVHALDDQVLTANLLAVTVALDTLSCNVPDFDPLVVATGTPGPDSLSKMLTMLFTTLPNELHSFNRIASALIARYIPLLAGVMPNAQARVRVAIDPHMEQTVYHAIRQSLERMPAVEIITNPKYARLIISSDMRVFTPQQRGKRGHYYFALSSYSAWLTLEYLVHYLAIHECGLRTGSGIGYTQVTPELIGASFN